MSVINSVLKELDSRSSQFTAIDIASVDQQASDKAPVMKLPVMVLLSLFFIAGLGLWYFQLQEFPVQLVKSSPVIDVLPEPETITPVSNASLILSKVDAEETVAKRNRIVGLQFRESSSDISLEFAMQEKAVSYLKERSEKSFTYHIKNIDNDIEAPRITGNRWIKSLSILPAQKGVDVTLQTVTGVLVKTAQSQKQDESIWTIKLEKLAAPVVVAEPEPVAVESAVESKQVTKQVVEATQAIVETIPEAVKVDIKTASHSVSEFAKLNKALEFMQARRWQNAETLLLELIDGPQDLSARKQLLGVYTQSGYAGRYNQLARASSDRYPQQNLFKTEYARSLFQQQSYREVIALLKSVEQLDSKQQSLIAASYQRLEQHGKAIEHYHHSLKLNKREAKNWIGLGISLEHQAKLDKALQSYQMAVRVGNLNQKLKEFVTKRSRLLKKVTN